MNGAESLVHTLADSGIELCLGNPGTSEMHFVAALDREPRLRGVLGLFEGVVTGAADGYARMAGKPAVALLHLGPGFASFGIANTAQCQTRRFGQPGGQYRGRSRHIPQALYRCAPIFRHHGHLPAGVALAARHRQCRHGGGRWRPRGAGGAHGTRPDRNRCCTACRTRPGDMWRQGAPRHCR